MNFAETEKYLLSLGNEVSAMKLGLENIRKLLAALGDPQTKYLKVQVAGTNGKGSVCAFLNSICLTADIKTGMYTSPHLISITERVQIDGVNITKEKFAQFGTLVRETSERLVASGEIENVPTFFEQVTAIALIAFAEANVSLAILETGLGGRLDATTAANAEIAAITRIDYDHQNYLGETIEDIAAEKAAIIHAGSRVVVGEQRDEAMNVILARCNALGIAQRLAVHSMLRIERTQLGLAGNHQIENARVAATLCELLRDHFPISDRQVVSGLEAARHPGRLEWIGRYLLDGAHNPGGAKALRDYLDEFVTAPITMVFGAMRDKAVAEIVRVLSPVAERLILTRPHNSRAHHPTELLDVVGPENVVTTDDVASALRKAEELSSMNDVIVVTGSLYLVGEARNFLSGISDN